MLKNQKNANRYFEDLGKKSDQYLDLYRCHTIGVPSKPSDCTTANVVQVSRGDTNEMALFKEYVHDLIPIVKCLLVVEDHDRITGMDLLKV